MRNSFFALSLFVSLSATSMAGPIKEFSSSNKSGMVLKVEKGSLWEKAGFVDGDIIKAIDGVSAEHIQNSQHLVDTLRSGADHFTFKVLRSGKIVDVEVSVK
ncbi:MAG: PDZ domain-containing protein [bacterium]|nr:PDZ domain-containing protein [bacterium]